MQWEQEVAESKYAAGLEQLPEGMGKWGRKIPADASQWQCDETGTTENLWLNLGTGFIGSGRQAGTSPTCAVAAAKARESGWARCGGYQPRVLSGGVAAAKINPWRSVPDAICMEGGAAAALSAAAWSASRLQRSGQRTCQRQTCARQYSTGRRRSLSHITA